MVLPSKLAQDLTETSRIIDLKDPQIRSLLLSLGTRALALVGSMVCSYFLIRYALKHLDPTHEEKKRQKELAEIISQKMNLPKELVNNFNEYEMCLLTDLINPVDIKVTWQDIGGLDEIIDNVRQTVIYPLQHPELFNQSKLLTTPKGVLLYGPPGCGKTMLAKAIAREAGANFINLQVRFNEKNFFSNIRVSFKVTSLLDKWYGESQKRTAAIFSLAKKLQPTIIFIDEIDSFMRTRQNDDHECTRMV
jgi:SpoVK/Ycf46/Vps4 family AAA+-type ATPase